MALSPALMAAMAWAKVADIAGTLSYPMGSISAMLTIIPRKYCPWLVTKVINYWVKGTEVV
jgi:hypothetical protein